MTNTIIDCKMFYAITATMAQEVERVLGKDEVTGSNPVSSSKTTDRLMSIGGFVFKRKKR